MSEPENGVKCFADMTTIEKLRNNLQPGGTAPVVGLHLNERFFNHDFIKKCINELERMPMRAALGEAPSNLEKLAYTLLMDSAYLETK